jgi:two-component system sensor histidine kinase ChvG
VLTVLDKTVDDKTAEIDDTVGDDALAGSAGTAGTCAVKHRAAAGRLRFLRKAVSLFRRRTVDFFVHAWQVLRTEGPVGALRHTWQFLISQSFSSLTRRIVFFNVAGLLAFVLGILYLTQFRAGLIDARVQALVVQGQTIATTIAYQGTDPDPIKIDLDQLFKSYNSTEHKVEDFEFSLPPDRVAPLLRRLIEPSKTLARIYDVDGGLLLDSRNLRGDRRADEPPAPPAAADKPGILERPFIAIRKWLARGDLPPYRDIENGNGKAYKEVAHALDGEKDNKGVYLNDRGQVVVLVAVPIQRADSPVRAVLLLSTQGGDIDHAVEAERLAILKVFLIDAGIISVLSMLLASTIAGPVRRLADSAERVRRRVKGRVEIPDFTNRHDEIGHLSGNLREMTKALYSRIEAIESFAAEVAHELKNPLTSLRSAVETLPLAKTDESRNRLLSVVKHDVQRLDRLISDISNASRLDAELQRQEAAPVDLRRLLVAVVAMAKEVKHEDVKVTLVFEGSPRIFKVQGHDSRLSQVMNNLIDNARSFSPPGGTVRVTCRRTGREILITVDDDGPGIRPDAIDKIFERFYTDRPQQNFGQNSGLGLSISKQIVEAHEGGHLSAQNRVAPREPGTDAAAEDRILGARFSVRLPAM